MAISVLSLSGCSLFRPYHQQIQQGNIITSQMIAKIKPGMTRKQVEFVLGTPNIQDPWHPHKLYYAYTNKEDGLPVVANRLVLSFKDGKLDSIDGTYPPPSTLQYKTYKTS